MMRSWDQKTKEITKKDNVTKMRKLPLFFISQKFFAYGLKREVTNKNI